MAAIILLETIAFLAVALIWWLCLTSIKNKSPIRNWPLVGMLPGLLSNASHIHDYFTHLLDQSNQTIEIKGPKFSNLNLTLTSDPENIHYILSTNFANFNKGEDFKDIFEMLGDGILVADSDSWKMQRRLTHSLFKNRDFLSLLEATARQKVKDGFFKILDHASKSGIEVDMQDLCQRFTFDVTCIFLLGSDLNSLSEGLPEVSFAKALDDIEGVCLHRHLKPRSMWKLQKWMQVGVEKKSTRAAETFDNFIYHQICLKREQNKKSSEIVDHDKYRHDLISIFMEEEVAAKCSNDSTKPSDKFLRDSVMNILSAGRDTSSTALTWFFYLVITNPQVESKLVEELEVSFQMKPGEPWEFPSFAELNKLVYLHATLCETLRLYPPVPFNHKASIKPDILPSGHKVHKGTKIIISIYTMGRMQEIWGADATVFKPERWISKTGNIIDVPSYKFNVFSAGPRTCLGKDLAFMKMKIAAAAIVWRYGLQMVRGGAPVTPSNSVILRMKHGLKVNVATRTGR
ncbi:hypothetical protein QQ045_008781 [Rhodiola kirilowii]